MDLQEHLQSFVDVGTQVLAVAVHTQDNAKQIMELSGATFPLLADPDHAVTQSYGVYDLLGDGRAAPATFIIDAEGMVAWAYVGKDNNDRPTAETLLQELGSR